MRKAEAHFDLAQLIAKAIDLGVNPEAVEGTALELEA